MQAGDYTVDVGLKEATADLIGRLDAVPNGTVVRLNVPRSAVTLRTLEDYNELRALQKRRNLQITVVTPEPTIQGLARILGFEVENSKGGAAKAVAVPDAPSDEALPQWGRAAAPPTAAWPDYGAAPTPSPSPKGGGEFDGGLAASSTPGLEDSAAAAMTDNEWLFGSDLPADSLHLALPTEPSASRSAVPPPDVTLPAVAFVPTGLGARTTAVPVPTTPPNAGSGLDALDELDSLNFDEADLEAQEAGYRQEIAAQAAARSAERIAAGLPDLSAPTPVDDGTSPFAAAASVVSKGRFGGMGRRDSGKAAPPPPTTGGRTFVDRTAPSAAAATVLGAGTAAATTLERRASPAPPTEAELADVSNRPLPANGNGSYSATIIAPAGIAEPSAAYNATPAGGAGDPTVTPPSSLGKGAVGARSAAPVLAEAAAGYVATPGFMPARPIARPVATPRAITRAVPTTRPQTRRRWGAALFVVLGVAVILAGLSAILFFNPPGLATANIVITPRQSADLGTVRIEVPVLMGAAGRSLPGLAAPGLVTATLPLTSTPPLTGTTAPLPPAAPRVAQPVQAQRINAEFSSNKSVPTSGVKQVPDKSAVGTIRFTNHGTGGIAIPGGTKLIGGNGKSYHTVNSVTVPATDFTALVFGLREVDIQADAPGLDYNKTELGGAYGNASYTTIRQPAGGTTRPVKIVDAKDLAAVQAALKDDLRNRASGEILGKVPPDRLPLTCTLQLPTGDADYAVGALPAVGAEADSVSSAMTTTASVYVYAPAEVRHHAALAALDAAPQNLPPIVEAAIDPSSIDETKLTLTQASGCDGGRVVFRTETNPRLLYTVTLNPQIIEQIKTRVRGLTPQAAEAAIYADPTLSPYIQSVKVTAVNPPTFFKQATEARVPDLAANISVGLPNTHSVGTGGGGSTPAPTVRPAATGEPK